MFKKTIAAAAIGLGTLMAIGAPAAAENSYPEPEVPSGPSVRVGLINGNVGNNLCVAPWHWEGPGTALNPGSDYKACNNPEVQPMSPADVELGLINGNWLNNWCVAPWNWEGPLTFMNGSSPYRACNKPRA